MNGKQICGCSCVSRLLEQNQNCANECCKLSKEVLRETYVKIGRINMDDSIPDRLLAHLH